MAAAAIRGLRNPVVATGMAPMLQAKARRRRRRGRLATRLHAAPLPGTVNTVSEVPEWWPKASV
jgi:hypothetical protein